MGRKKGPARVCARWGAGVEGASCTGTPVSPALGTKGSKVGSLCGGKRANSLRTRARAMLSGHRGCLLLLGKVAHGTATGPGAPGVIGLRLEPGGGVVPRLHMPPCLGGSGLGPGGLQSTGSQSVGHD